MSKNSEPRCLAVQQTYAWAICANVKDIENRSWQTKHRGTVVIVTSATTARIKQYQKAVNPKTLSGDHLTVAAAIGLVDLGKSRTRQSHLSATLIESALQAA